MVNLFSSFIVDVNSVRLRAMFRDESDYPDPESFKPERYLKNGLPDLTVRDPTTIMFGFGRRWGFFWLRSLARPTFAKKYFL